ncbi:hypothetical protein HNQ59_003564 [Chitinivorax tropicus]|uniref:Uncharacterized protein n=1 Tax=Chitinivorax tropicus TaxID=714531 RepID=A0A840MST6_9PROT|nr:hypothetical protein [Chitinivorax tropicus]
MGPGARFGMTALNLLKFSVFAETITRENSKWY